MEMRNAVQGGAEQVTWVRVRMVPVCNGFTKQFFDFTMVWKQYAFSRKCTLNFIFSWASSMWYNTVP